MYLNLLRAKEAVGKDATPFGQRGQQNEVPQIWHQPLLAPHPVLLQFPPRHWDTGLQAAQPGQQSAPAPPPGPHCLWEKQVHPRSPSTAEATAPLLTVLTVNTEPLFSSLLPAEGSFLPLDLGAVREGGHGAFQ